jgi:hypothetical protein
VNFEIFIVFLCKNWPFFRHARWPIFPTIFGRKNEKTNKETLPEERFGTFTRLSFGRALEFH